MFVGNVGGAVINLVLMDSTGFYLNFSPYIRNGEYENLRSIFNFLGGINENFRGLARGLVVFTNILLYCHFVKLKCNLWHKSITILQYLYL